MTKAVGIWTISFNHDSEGFIEEIKSYAVPGPGTEINLGFSKDATGQYRVVSTRMDYVNMRAVVEVM